MLAVNETNREQHGKHKDVDRQDLSRARTLRAYTLWDFMSLMTGLVYRLAQGRNM
jgi:hypothetical protein